jgi:hypothetical protein
VPKKFTHTNEVVRFLWSKSGQVLLPWVGDYKFVSAWHKHRNSGMCKISMGTKVIEGVYGLEGS